MESLSHGEKKRWKKRFTLKHTSYITKTNKTKQKRNKPAMNVSKVGKKGDFYL